MPQRQQPSDIHPEFTTARLSHIAGIIRTTRKSVIGDHYDRRLDSRWSIGCFAFQRIAKTIELAATGDDREANWLEVVTDGLHFVFSIGGVPVRFYRGKTDRPAPTGQTTVNVPEMTAFQLVLDLFADDDPSRYCYRVVYETDHDTLLASRIFFAELDKESGAVTYAWQIPDDGIARSVPITGGDRPIDLEPAAVELVEEIIAAEEDELKKERGT